MTAFIILQSSLGLVSGKDVIPSMNADPDIWTNPSGFDFSLVAGDTDTGVLTVGNNGTSMLNYSIVGASANNKVLLLDGANAGSTEAIDALIAEGFNVTDAGVPSSYNGVPDPNDFDVVILLIGDDYTLDMPAAGQTAIESYVSSGGNVIATEWIGFHVQSGRYTTLAPMVPMTRGGGNHDVETCTVMLSHPITQGIPSPFTTVHHSFGVMSRKAGAVELVDGSLAGDELSYWSYGTGTVVHFATVGRYSTYNAWTDANLLQLLLNAAHWMANATVTTLPDWLSISPGEGSIAPPGTIDHNLKVNTTTLAPGFYQYNITIINNDPDENPKIVPVNLTVAPSSHELVITNTTIDGSLEAGKLHWVNGTVMNQGASSESPVQVRFLVNFVLTNFTVFAVIGPGAQEDVSFEWTPPLGLQYTVTLYVMPAPGENNTSNNWWNKTANITAAPDITVTPRGFTFMVEAGLSDSDVMTIGNTGLGGLFYNITDDVSDIGNLTIFEDDFEDGNPSPWTGVAGTGIGGVSTDTAQSGIYSMYTAHGTYTWTSPVMDLSTASTVELSLWIRQGGAFGNSENPDTGEDLEIYYYNNVGSYVLLDTFLGADAAGTIYTPVYSPLPADANHANFRLQFYQTGGSGTGFDYWHIDDVAITAFISTPAWLSENPITGSINPGGGDDLITVGVDTSSLTPGFYQGNITVSSNDPGEPAIIVPVNLTVLSAPHDVAVINMSLAGNLQAGKKHWVNGTILNQGTSDETNIQVIFTVDTVMQNSTVITSLPSGTLDFMSFEWTPPSGTQYDLTLLAVPVPGETLVADNWWNMTETFTAEPDIWVNPGNFNFAVQTGLTDSAPLTIGNDGLANLDWSIYSQVSCFEDDFEDGNYNGWVHGSGTYTRTVTSATAAAGSTYSFTQIGGSSAHRNGVSQNIGVCAPEHISFYIRSASSTAADAYVLFQLGNQLPMYIYADDNGMFIVNSLPRFAYSANVWYHIEFSNINWTTHFFDLVIDGAPVQANIPFAQITNSIDTIYLYNFHNSQSWWDEIVLGMGMSGGLPSWLTVTPDMGTVPPSSQTNTNVGVDAAGMSPGLYRANISIASNDPDENPYNIPVNLTVLSALHDLAVLGMTVAGSQEAGKPLWINGTVHNLGQNDEANVVVNLRVNSATVDTYNIAFIASGQTIVTPFVWIPPAAGTYAIEVYVVPVIGETITANNYDTRSVVVTAEPDIWVNPGGFDFAVQTGMTDSDIMTIGNNGLGILNYTIGVSSGTIEDFENAGSWPWAPWISPVGGGGIKSAAAAHDGSYGLTDTGSTNNWRYRTDYTVGNPGDKMSVWVRSPSVDGRVYFGFGATASGCWSLVFAPNTNQFMFQQNTGYSGFMNLNSVVQVYTASWYRMEIEWMTSTSLIGRLYDSSGSTLINTVSQTIAGLTPSGVSLRSFLGNQIDTLEYPYGSGGPIASWLTVTPDQGTVPAMSQTNLVVAVDTAGLPVGYYQANITISNNDPDEDPYIVPVNLTVITAQHDLAVIAMTVQGTQEVGEPLWVNGTIQNQGVNDESNVNVQLRVDSVVQDSTVIGFLPSGQINVVPLVWTPSSTGTYTVSVFVAPVPGETNTVNNEDDVLVTITAPPDIWVSPGGFDFVVPTGSTDSDILTIGNTGLGSLYYNVTDDIYTTHTFFYDDFEDGDISDWLKTGTGTVEVTTQTANSGVWSMNTHGGAAVATSQTIDLSGTAGVNIEYWIREGDSSFSEPPDPNEDLYVEYRNNVGSWIQLDQFLGAGPNGVIYTRNHSLPANALHPNFAVRFRQSMASGPNFDYWHIDDVWVYSTSGFGVDWLSESPMTGSIPQSGGNDLITVTVDTTALTPGYYQGNISVTSNDPGQPTIIIPVNLTVTTHPHDLAVISLSVQGTQEAGKPLWINGTVHNQGMNSESNINVQLQIDLVLEHVYIIPFLSSGAITSVYFVWTPVTTGNFDISIYAVPVAGETYTTNNRMSQMVVVTGVPEIWVSPGGFDFAVQAGSTSSNVLTVGNIGYSTLSYNVTDDIVSYVTFLDDDFEDGDISDWVVSAGPGIAGAGTHTSNSGSWSMHTYSGIVSVTTQTYDTSSCHSLSVEYWIREGGGGCTPPSENPDSGENLLVEYYNDIGSWVLLDMYLGDTYSGGHIFGLQAYNLPPDALHPGFRMRFRQTGGSGGTLDWWHIDDVLIQTTGGSDVEWLTETPNVGIIPPGGSNDLISVQVDASELSPGDYQGNITVGSNDIHNPAIRIPVNLTVLPPPHDIRVLDIKIEGILEVGSLLWVNSTILNQGMNDEMNVEVQFSIDGVNNKTEVIPNIISGTQQIVSFEWTPIVGGVHNLSVYAVPVIGETILTNNQRTLSVNITTPPDILPPYSCVTALTPYWQTATPSTIFATASDLDGQVAYVELWYRFSENNLTWGSWSRHGVDLMGPIWSWSFQYPDDGYFEFYSIACDQAGHVESPPTTADACAAFDQTPPVIFDMNDVNPTTGDTYIFQAIVFENFVVSNVSITYWYGNGTSVTAALTESVPSRFSHSTIIPYTSIDPVHYYIRATDEAGNTATTPPKTLAVLDNDAPTPVITQYITVYAGEVVTLDASASTDNIGITSYVWEFIDGSQHMLIGSYVSHTFNDVGTYSVMLTVEDAAGNTQIAVTMISVVTPPLDSDGDGVPDTEDDFPFDPDETVDTDGDGIGNNADTDDDGDGIRDSIDPDPLIPNDDLQDNIWDYLWLILLFILVSLVCIMLIMWVMYRNRDKTVVCPICGFLIEEGGGCPFCDIDTQNDVPEETPGTQTSPPPPIPTPIISKPPQNQPQQTRPPPSRPAKLSKAEIKERVEKAYREGKMTEAQYKINMEKLN